jgi:hypothetical protein
VFGFGKTQKSNEGPVNLAMRETLFGDMPWEQWAKPSDAEPWHTFAKANEHRLNGFDAEAVEELSRILKMPQLESRCYLQAWHFLRSLNVNPPADVAKHVYGVVIEVALPQGLDLLACYEDGSARYWNFSGAGIVWEARNDPAIEAAIRELLNRGQLVAAKIGPWLEPRRAAPATGFARLNMLTPSGLHFGEAPTDALAKDPMGGYVMSAGVDLMKLLTEKGLQAQAQK